MLTEAEFNRELVKALPKLRQAALRLLRTPQGADDLVNDTVVRAMTHRHQFQPGTNMAGWLSVICRNHLYSANRRKKLVVQGTDLQLEAAVQPENQLHTVMLKQTLDAVEKLSPDMREAVYVMAFEDSTYEEASAIIGIPAGTLKSRVSRARKRLLEG